MTLTIALFFVPVSVLVYQYEDDSAPCLDTSVQMKMDFDNLKLEYVVYKYGLNGSFLGSEEVRKQQ